MKIWRTRAGNHNDKHRNQPMLKLIFSLCSTPLLANTDHQIPLFIFFYKIKGIFFVCWYLSVVLSSLGWWLSLENLVCLRLSAKNMWHPCECFRCFAGQKYGSKRYHVCGHIFFLPMYIVRQIDLHNFSIRIALI